MISVSGKRWEEKKANKNLIEKLKQDHNFSNILSKLVISREFDETEISSIDNYLGLNNVFFKNSDFERSIELVTNSINKKENICILGDYDVDGSAATSLFIRFFESIKHPFFYYIPDREKDGYGATKKLFQESLMMTKLQQLIQI
jgi:single-stranded-DNA-specific exonuclease